MRIDPSSSDAYQGESLALDASKVSVLWQGRTTICRVCLTPTMSGRARPGSTVSSLERTKINEPTAAGQLGVEPTMEASGAA